MTYTHDCTKCRFLETTQVEGKTVDWYHCGGNLGGSLIGRTGNEGGDYWSSPVGVMMNAMCYPDPGPWFTEASRLWALHHE